MKGRSPVCLLLGYSEFGEQRRLVDSGRDIPDMASEMLRAREDHATVAVAAALEGLGGSSAVALGGIRTG